MVGFVDLAIAAPLVVLGMVFWFLGVPYKVGITSGIALLFFSAISNWLGNPDLGSLSARFAYYFLLIGVLFAVVKFRRKPVEVSEDP